MRLLFLVSCYLVIGSDAWCPQQAYVQQRNTKFEQKTDRFWEFHEESDSWVEVELPYDLISCVNGNCTKVGSIDQAKREEGDRGKEQRQDVCNQDGKMGKNGADGVGEKHEVVLPLRKRISLVKMSETSVWVTGESGSIYERFWNGVQWVIAPHDLPVLSGPATGVFFVNQTILALSQFGLLYQMQLNDGSQPAWVELTVALNQNINKETEHDSTVLIKSGVVSHDRMRIYFCTKNLSLMELAEVDPPRWVDHGMPSGANVAAIAASVAIRAELIYTISSSGDLYEYDKASKPSWKKHIHVEGTAKHSSLLASRGYAVHELIGDYSMSLFLLTKRGKLVERRLHQRKWKWIIHGGPKDHHLTSITPAPQDESNEKLSSLFFTTSAGSVFEYRVQKSLGTSKRSQIPETWSNHLHPEHAKVARGVSGLQLHFGRLVFPLDDGRLGELHLPGLGGETIRPSHQVHTRRKSSTKYKWSILEAPETEGWNAEYCKEERGPTNCITGVKDEQNDSGTVRSAGRKRKGGQSQDNYLVASSSDKLKKPSDGYSFPNNWINSNFRLRMMHGGNSFFLVTDGGLTFEYLHTEKVWLWLKHEHSTPILGALGNYNGSLFLVDLYGTLLIRERSGNELAWINCTAMRKGKQVVGGPPWDGIPGRAMKVTTEDSLFFVSRSGRLLQFNVALRKFKWKDCRNPSSTKVASIVDQELFRDNIVLVIGSDGRLYQYNKVTELWHEHYQSQHLTLSILPGSAARPHSQSLAGSLFMLSGDGGLIEYQWNAADGWNWVEHGTPNKAVALASSPSPCFEGNQVFLIGSDGKVYMRYKDQMIWKWKNCGYPFVGKPEDDDQRQQGPGRDDACIDEDFSTSLNKDAENFNDAYGTCDYKVASTRPIPYSDVSMIFELRDGRLAELRQVEGVKWAWSRIIGTPQSSCIVSYWSAGAS